MTHSTYRRWKNRTMMMLMGAAFLLCLVPLGSLLWTLGARGGPAISFRFLTGAWAPVGQPGGIAHAIAGSICLLLIASLLAVPLGLAKGLFLARHGDTKLAAFVRLLLDAMTGIPAIVVGVFIYGIAVQRDGFSLNIGFSMLAGGMALAMIMLPIFARTTEEAVRAIPLSVDEAGLALGLSRRRVILRLVLRAAVPAVLSGLFLAVARVAGEAAPLLFTAFGSNHWPESPMQPVASLPQLLFDYARQPFEQLVQQAWGAALVLVVMILTIRLATHGYVRWRYGTGGYS